MARHTAVWIDHKQARVFQFHPSPTEHRHREEADTIVIEAPQHLAHRHSLSRGGEAAAHPEDSTHFFGEVAAALADSESVFIVGPSSAKFELVEYLKDTAPRLAQHVIGVETVDHPTDPQIVALARNAFVSSDRLGR